jgi:tryptophanyl-tRNA synthetase
MSKSDLAARPGSVLLLTEDPKALTKKLKSAKTDSGSEVRAGDDKPELTNLLTMFSAVEGTPVADLEERFKGSGYGDFKGALAEAVVAALEPIRLRYDELMNDPAEIDRMLATGAEKAAEVAAGTMDLVRERTGLGSRPVLEGR